MNSYDYVKEINEKCSNITNALSKAVDLNNGFVTELSTSICSRYNQTTLKIEVEIIIPSKVIKS